MNSTLRLVLAAVALSVGKWAPASAQQPELVAKLERIGGMETDSTMSFRITIRMTPDWHIGAPRPGAFGVPTELSWRLPPGWRLTGEKWPAPKPEAIGRDSAFTYSGSLVIEASITKGASGRESIEVVLSYGICSKELCIPGRKTLTHGQ